MVAQVRVCGVRPVDRALEQLRSYAVPEHERVVNSLATFLAQRVDHERKQ